MKLRIHFLKNFTGHKLENPPPQCSIECFFWERIFSYYPNNTSSPSRFLEFGPEFLRFLLDNKLFSEDYVTWIQENSERIIKQFDDSIDPKITSYDAKLYADILLNTIKEILHCVMIRNKRIEETERGV